MEYPQVSETTCGGDARLDWGTGSDQRTIAKTAADQRPPKTRIDENPYRGQRSVMIEGQGINAINARFDIGEVLQE
jgi:hypothetical protein